VTWLLSYFARPYEWGRVDCCTCAADVFRALHGVDPMTGMRGSYATALGAARVIRKRGGFEAMAHDQAGVAGLRPGTGAVGDLGLVLGERAEMGGALAICAAPGVWWMKARTGMTSAREVSAMWRA
jgi:hypothetical protein